MYLGARPLKTLKVSNKILKSTQEGAIAGRQAQACDDASLFQQGVEQQRSVPTGDSGGDHG